jgi:hypothetical protein
MRPLTDEEMAKVEAEAKREAEKFECEKRIWNLFDLAIEKNKAEGFTDQDIQLKDFSKDSAEYRAIFEEIGTCVCQGPNRLKYVLKEGFEQILKRMLNNCLMPEQFYMNPIMATYCHTSDLTSYLNTYTLRHLLTLFGNTYYLGLSVSLPPNVFYILPAPSHTGVSAFSLFSMFPSFKDEIWLEKYVDLPEEVNKYTGLRLINVKAPYRVTVPASLLK